MRRALRLLLKTLLWLLAALAALCLILLAFPSLVLNSRTAAWAVHRYGKGYAPSWKVLELHVSSRSLLTKRIEFRAEDFCFRESHGATTGCFPLLDLRATVRLGLSPLLAVRRLERLVIHSDGLYLNPAAAPPAPEKKSAGPTSLAQLVPRPLRGMTLGVLDVKVPHAVVQTASGTVTARFQAAFDDKLPRPLGADAYVVTAGTEPATVSRYEAHATLDSDYLRKGTLTALQARAGLRGDGGLRAHASAEVRQAGAERLALAAQAEGRMAGRTLTASLDGSKTPALYAARAGLAVEDSRGPLSRAELKDCAIRGPLDRRTQRLKAADLSCGVSLGIRRFGPRKWARLKPITGSIESHTDFRPKGLHPGDYFTSDLRARLGLPEQWYAFHTGLSVDLTGRTGRLPESLNAHYDFDTGFDIRDFGKLVSFLEGTAYAVPAPLNSLRGSASLGARSAGQRWADTQRAEYGLTTDLSGGKQRLKTGIRGTATLERLFGPDRRIASSTEVDLKEVAFELPYLKIGSIPSPTVDTRIRTGAPGPAAKPPPARTPKPASSAMQYEAHVFTSKPVILYSNLLQNPAPVSLDLRAAQSGLSGKIRIETFQTKVFRQAATIDHITLIPTPGTSVMNLDGKIVIKRAEATIDVLLQGSTAKPQVVFQSDPPMTQDEIVSLLLFNQYPDQLSASQQATAGNASQAFTSRALGMASLLLFASTPIDSVNYDTATQTYQIRFKLPGGATLAVGSNLEEARTLTLRKLLTHSLEIETELTQRPGQPNAVTTFLQWFRRY